MSADRAKVARWAAFGVAVGIALLAVSMTVLEATCGFRSVSEPCQGAADCDAKSTCEPAGAFQVIVAGSFGAWAAFLALAARIGQPAVAWVAFAAYLGEAAIFGFSMGGVHLMFGVIPFAIAASLLTFLRVSPPRAAGATAE